MQKIKHIICGTDKRSLAVFRFFMGLSIVWDLLFNRYPDLMAHYSDSGVSSRLISMGKVWDESAWSLHWVNGTVLYQGLLFWVNIVSVSSWTVGYKTQLCAIVNWVLICSLQTYQQFYLHNGDVWVRIFLLWCIFLPMGDMWSVDAVLRRMDGKKPVKNTAISSIATFALFMHLPLCYMVSVLHKSGDEWWGEGSAVFYAISLKYYRTFIGSIFYMYPSVMTFLTHFTIFYEFVGPILFFVPIFTDEFRIVAIVGFMGMHMGFASCLKLGFFFLVTFFTFPIYLPPKFWDVYFFPWFRKDTHRKMVYFNEKSKFSKFLVFSLEEIFFTNLTSIGEISHLKKKMDVVQSGIWIAITNKDELLVNMDALVVVLGLCPLLWPLGTLFSILPIKHLIGHVAALLYYLFFQKKIKQPIEPETDENALKTISRAKKITKTVKITKTLIVNGFLTLLVLTALLWNIGNSPIIGEKILRGVEIPHRVRQFGWIFRLDQNWNMFSPRPQQYSFWYVVPGELINGKQVELFREGGLNTWNPSFEIKWEEPEDWDAAIANHRWYKYYDGLLNLTPDPTDRLEYGKFICREYNKRHEKGDQIYSFQIYLLQHRVFANNTWSAIEKTELWSHICFDPKPNYN